MAKSLADQLLSAGLVDSKKLKQIQQEKRRDQKQQSQGPKARGPNVNGQQGNAQAEQKRQLEQARAAKVQQDRLLNEQRQQAERNKELRVQVRQILEQHTVPAAGEIRFNFKDGDTGRIRYLFVSEAQQAQLAAGQLLICAFGKRAVLVTRDTGERIRERLPAAVLFDASMRETGQNGQSGQESDTDDAYKDFPIPDDLMW